MLAMRRFECNKLGSPTVDTVSMVYTFSFNARSHQCAGI